MASRIHFDPPQRTTITRTFERPVSERERLGGVPQDYYESSRGWPRHGMGGARHHPGAEGGPRNIKRDVPRYNADGSPRMETVTETLSEETYHQKDRTFGFGVLGAIAGGLAAATLLAAGPLAIVAGVALGAAAGSRIGYKSAQDDEVQEVWEKRDVVHPHMEGHTHYTVPVPEFDRRCTVDEDGNEECQVDVSLAGYYHHFQPSIREEKVGEYQEPTLQHTRKLRPVAGAIVTVGAAIALGLAAGAVDRLTGDD